MNFCLANERVRSASGTEYEKFARSGHRTAAPIGQCDGRTVGTERVEWSGLWYGKTDAGGLVGRAVDG